MVKSSDIYDISDLTLLDFEYLFAGQMTFFEMVDAISWHVYSDKNRIWQKIFVDENIIASNNILFGSSILQIQFP